MKLHSLVEQMVFLIGYQQLQMVTIAIRFYHAHRVLAWSHTKKIFFLNFYRFSDNIFLVIFMKLWSVLVFII